MQVKKWLVAGAVAACAAVAAVVVLGTGASAAPQSTFVLLDGSRQTTQDLRGKVTLVNFWATSCTTCVGEMPMLKATQEKYGSQGYRTLAVAMQYDPPAYVVNFVKTRQLPFDVALDSTGSAARNWGNISITPTSFLLNKKGEIVKRYVGEPNFDELHRLIEKLLAEA